MMIGIGNGLSSEFFSDSKVVETTQTSPVKVVYSSSCTDFDSVQKRRVRSQPTGVAPLTEGELGVDSELEIWLNDEAWWPGDVAEIRSCDGAIRVSLHAGKDESYWVVRRDVVRLLRRHTVTE